MGYLNKETVTVDAILTRKGRELLAQGRSAFEITQFAVADDEIDYGLYNPAHPLGTEYYGSAIENMPVVEASTDETQNLRYKLVSLSSGLNVLPRISLGGLSSLSFDVNLGGATSIIPTTTVGSRTSELDGPDYGYTLVLFNTNAVTISATPVSGQVATRNTRDDRRAARRSNQSSGIAPLTAAYIGTAFSVTPKEVDDFTRTQITITGNQSGATITIPITVTPT
jgi:hypothetical protein